MPETRKRRFTLSSQEAEYIDAKVASGAYASASDVVRAGLLALQERDAAIGDYERSAGGAVDIIDELGLPAGAEDVELELPPMRDRSVGGRTP
jgi:putative addiction module CopG family antidote